MSGRRFPGRDTSKKTTVFQVDDIPHVKSEKLEPIERAAIERTVTEREVVIEDLQIDLVTLRSERNALESQLTHLQAERDELRDRIRQLEVERPALEPQTVFTDLGSAIGDVRAELGEANYTIGDVEFNLKANVTQSDEGLRMHLPSLDETFASTNLSEIRFRVQADPDAGADAPDYRELPDVGGLMQADAERQLQQAGLSVGTVDTEATPDSRPGTVLSQFPEPYTLAEPGSPVDLTITTKPEEQAEPAEPAPAEPATEQLREEFEHAIERAELDPESELAARLAEAGVDDLRELAAQDTEFIAHITELPEGTVDELYDRLRKRLAEERAPSLERIDGLGPTYIGRLREAGIETVAELADSDPEKIAKITQASVERAKNWLEQARAMEE